MGGGGKGGSSSSATQIPAWVEGPASRNLERTEDIQKIGYMPYYGPDVAAFNPTQVSAMQNTINAANAFGMAAPTSPLQGMPAPTIFADGTQGYSSAPLYEQSVAAFEEARPGQAAAYNELFVDPITGQTSSGQASAGLDWGNVQLIPVNNDMGGLWGNLFNETNPDWTNAPTTKIGGEEYKVVPQDYSQFGGMKGGTA